MSIWEQPESIKEDAESLREILSRSLRLGRTKKICTLIDRLSESGEIAAINSVASGLFLSNQEIHNAASNGVARLLRCASSIELMPLSELLGGYYHGYISAEWARIKPKRVASYLKETNDIAVGCLLSLHKNGYVRQAAVRFLSGVESGEEIRFLLIRQNDWVDAIAEDAQSAVLDRLTANHLDRLIAESELLVSLLRFQRRDLSKTVSKFVDLLIAPYHNTHVNRALESCSAKTKRKLIELLLARDGGHLADIVIHGVTVDDGVIRSKCLRRASDCLPPGQCAEIAECLITDKNVSVRVESYELKASSSPDESVAVWQRGLFDKSRAVREMAMFYLKKAGTEAAPIYRQRLSRFPNHLPALSGLVCVGDATDLSLFNEALHSPYASRRVEAIRGIGRFGGESDVVRLQQSLLDESARVVKAAYQQLSDAKGNLDPGDLFCLINECKHFSGKTAILQLLLALGKWPAMSFLIRASANKDERFADYSRSLIHHTFHMNRVFTQPSPEQKIQIQTALDECVDGIPSDFTAELRSYLSSFGFSV